MSHVEERFGLKLPVTDNLHIIDLDPSTVNLLNAKTQVIIQAIGQMRAVMNALLLQPCDIFVDTTGMAFTYPLVKVFFGCKIFSYTHYPTVSEDMIKTVADGRKQFNN